MRRRILNGIHPDISSVRLTRPWAVLGDSAFPPAYRAPVGPTPAPPPPQAEAPEIAPEAPPPTPCEGGVGADRGEPAGLDDSEGSLVDEDDIGEPEPWPEGPA